MKYPCLALTLLLLTAGCGSGGGTTTQLTSPLTAQEVVEQCLSSDILDFAGVLELVQGLLEGGAAAPTPQIDLLQGVLQGGIFPWSIDLDGDTVVDLTGTIHLRDAAGNVTLPLNLLGLIDPDNLDLTALIAALPAGTTLHVDFDLTGLLLASGQEGTGTGSVDVEFLDGAISNASGSGTFSGGPCDMGFTFEDIGAEDLVAAGFPIADIDFEIDVDGKKATGIVTFDGTETAKVRTRLGNGPEESFDLPLNVPAPPP